MTHPLISGDVDQQMQADVDAHAAPPGMQHGQEPPMDQQFQAFMQNFARMMWNTIQGQPRQPAPPMGQATGAPPAAFSPYGNQGAGHWRDDAQMANVRLDERAFRRIEKLTDKKEEWKEWRIQVLNAVRECDKTVAESLMVLEKKKEPITDYDLTSTQQ